MTPTPAPAAAISPAARLSIAQMLGVMRVEFHRARTMRQPLCCLMVAVDGLDEVQEKGGWAAKQAAMRAAYDLLKLVAGQRACFGMSLLSGDRMMAIFPSTPPSQFAEFAAALNEAARKAPFELPVSLGGMVAAEKMPITLSLGAAHNLLAETNSSFEGLVEKAGRALTAAREGAGDKYVMWREAEAEIQGLRDDLAAQRESFRQEEALLQEEASEMGGLQQAALVDRIQQIFAKGTRTPELEAIEKEIVSFAIEELFEGRRKAVEAQMAEHKRLVDQLERRIAKLTALLGVTEEQLQKVLSMKTIDEGVASIYRTVQGLSQDAAAAEQKRAMMSEIFRQNLSFQKREAQEAAA